MEIERFDINSSIIFQLGEQLITDEVQALVELIKNSYDAGARIVRIQVNTQEHPNEPWMYRESIGYILLTDDGAGMGLDDIRNGWLTISNSSKRSIKASYRHKEETSASINKQDFLDSSSTERVPLGDKGLGRLGAQRLGNNIEIITRSKNSTIEHHIGFSWKDFLNHTHLSKVEIKRLTRQSNHKPGTRIMISDLKDPDFWLQESTETALSFIDKLSKMINPFYTNKDYKILVYVNGNHLPLAALAQRILDTSSIKYELKYSSGKLIVRGQLKLNYLRPPGRATDDVLQFVEAIEKDSGQSFLSYLLSNEKSKAYQIEASNQDGWYLDFGYEESLLQLDKVVMVDEQPADPGPFTGEIYAVSLGLENSERQDIFQTSKEFRDFIKRFSGIRIYRDGFGVRVDEDWLGLGKRQTSGTSYNSLKPGNTIGFIEISAKDNINLEETTSREGFTDTPYYRNLHKLLMSFVLKTEQIQDYLRTQARQYYRDIILTKSNLPTTSTPETVLRQISSSLTNLENIKTPVKEAVKRIEVGQRSLTDHSKASPLFHTPELEEARQQVQTSLNDVKEAISSVGEYFQEIDLAKKEVGLLFDQIADLKNQINSMISVVALGLSAESLAHEILNVIERIIGNCSRIRNYLAKLGSGDKEVLEFINEVQSLMISMRKQVSYLEPGLKYVRDRKDKFSVLTAISEAKKYYDDFFINKKIQIKIINNRDFKLTMSRGKFTQILDNLIKNSEYWILESIRKNLVEEGEISIEINQGKIIVYDNGPGIDPNIEYLLFEPFITMKEGGIGRGLGLYICQQLLQTELCHIRLLPERNSRNRLFKFELDMNGAVL